MKIKDMSWNQCVNESNLLHSTTFDKTNINQLQQRIEKWIALEKRMGQLLYTEDK